MNELATLQARLADLEHRITEREEFEERIRNEVEALQSHLQTVFNALEGTPPMALDTMPNYRPDVALDEAHTFDLPQMCPVSGNPQPGSTLTVRYAPTGSFLEVEALHRYIDSFIGGRREGGVFVRDMEQTIQVIAAHCAAAVGVAVTIEADLQIATGAGVQHMRLVAVVSENAV